MGEKTTFTGIFITMLHVQRLNDLNYKRNYNFNIKIVHKISLSEFCQTGTKNIKKPT